jgi:hypothetical protein
MTFVIRGSGVRTARAGALQQARAKFVPIARHPRATIKRGDVGGGRCFRADKRGMELRMWICLARRLADGRSARSPGAPGSTGQGSSRAISTGLPQNSMAKPGRSPSDGASPTGNRQVCRVSSRMVRHMGLLAGNLPREDRGECVRVGREVRGWCHGWCLAAVQDSCQSVARWLGSLRSAANLAACPATPMATGSVAPVNPWATPPRPAPYRDWPRFQTRRQGPSRAQAVRRGI